MIPNIQNIPKVQNGRELGNRTIRDFVAKIQFPNILKVYNARNVGSEINRDFVIPTLKKSIQKSMTLAN